MNWQDQALLMLLAVESQTAIHYAAPLKVMLYDSMEYAEQVRVKWSIHARCGADFLTLTPGVRFADGDAGDQKRVTTPAKAKELGSDYIVVGRPITQAEDPVAAYRRCREEFVD